jgi:glycosyltransferase involved in cell wall biosynthesis
MPALHVVVVSTFPPDRGNLAEYGWHMSRALATAPGIARVTVLANEVASAPEAETIDGIEVRRVWRLNEPLTFLNIGRWARRSGADVAWVNAGIRTWGKSRRASAAGASVPGALRLLGVPVVTTLHTIGDTVALDRMGVGRVTQAGMRVASYAYLQSNVVTVTMPSMQAALIDTMGARNVAHVAHGTWGARVAHPPDPERLRILSFGFWGAFKDADLLAEATAELRTSGIDVELVLGGGPHPYFPEIYQRLVDRHAKDTHVRFTGYVPENELADLFRSVSLVVLPYRTNAGASGVLNLCRSFGLPTAISNEPALLEQLRFEGGSALVFEDHDSLIDALKRLLNDAKLRRQMGEANLAVARRVTIESQAALLSELFSDLVDGRPLDRWLVRRPAAPKQELLPRQSKLVSWAVR